MTDIMTRYVATIRKFIPDWRESVYADSDVGTGYCIYGENDDADVELAQIAGRISGDAHALPPPYAVPQRKLGWSWLALPLILAFSWAVLQQAGTRVTRTPKVTTQSQLCASADTTNVPDGPDPWGGCWPGPSNTGPNAAEGTMSTYGGSCTLTTPTTIDSKVINCSPLVIDTGSAGTVIKNSYLHGGVVQTNGGDGSTDSFTIQDSLLDNGVSYPACTSGPYVGAACPAGIYGCGDPDNGTTDCGVGYHNFTILRTEIINTIRGAWCIDHATIQDSYVHQSHHWPNATNLAHGSGFRNQQYCTFTHNSMFCDFGRNDGFVPESINAEIGCSADMSGYPQDTTIDHDTITFNLFGDNNVGVAYCIYAGSTAAAHSGDPGNAEYLRFEDNVFKKGPNGMCGGAYWVTDYITGKTGSTWLRNKFDDGTTAPPDG